MNTYNRNTPRFTIIGLLILAVLYSCSSQKDTVSNRKLQNLSARYNLIYNANVLLDEYLEGVHQSKLQNFDNFLPLYYAPEIADVSSAGSSVKELDAIATKARTVVAEKNLSNYIDESYILLGKTNFYQGKYYNAAEYFDYVAKTYKKDHNIRLNALNWQARSYIELNDLQSAQGILEQVKSELDSVKRKKAEPLATLAQMSIITENDKQAVEYLVNALKEGSTTLNKTQWTYTLAQLYENEKEFEKSLAAYNKVEKSNAAFDMYFNAKLSKIRINEALKGEKFDRKAQLRKMLKDDKNIDFVDQIYYEIAEDYYATGDLNKAEEYYKLSAKNSTKNNVQKGLSFLKVADLNFKDRTDYVTAKLYYDSTVLSLPNTHQLYQQIKDKAQNLAYLQQRYETISLQDTLQRIALLPANDRTIALNNYLNALEASKSVVSNADENTNVGRASATYTTQTNGTFYFANSSAISKGFNEFKKRWGNRKLTNNWRQSAKSATQNIQDNQLANNNGPGNLPSSPDEAAPATSANSASKIESYLDSLPITPALLESSNQKIIAAYLDMGSFYQQVLKDKPEAIKTYETLLKRFPNNNKLDVIYYSLYLAYQHNDNIKATEYKNLVLSKYPSSLYAKIILDPNFSAKQNQLEATLNTEYETLFTQLNNKDYKTVITGVDAINQRFPGNKMAPQYNYLKAIAIGRTDNVDQLISAFKNITENNKEDKLIVPLVAQHLAYIDAHLSEFKKRKIALLEYDPNEASFGNANSTAIRLNEPIIANLQNPTGKKVFETYTKPAQTVVAPKKEEPKPVVAEVKPKVNEVKKDSIIVKKPLIEDSVTTTIIANKPAEIISEVVPEKEDLFNPASSATYYYVVAVRSVTLSVSTSRFGIGQFNRGNFSGSNLRHQLKEMEKDQLIIVGDFGNIGDVQRYQKNIKTQLDVIMKVPATTYTTFAISKENLSKITNRETLDRYIRYINSNEL